MDIVSFDETIDFTGWDDSIEESLQEEIKLWEEKSHSTASAGSMPSVEIPKIEYHSDPMFQFYTVPLVGIDVEEQIKYNISQLNKLWISNTRGNNGT